MLNIINHIPEKLLHLTSNRIHEVLSGPTLIHLEGKNKRPLFVSVLLHGNEDSGFIAIQNLLKIYEHLELPRSLSILIGNIEAAKYEKRRLTNQPDYNRIWFDGDLPESQMTLRIVDEMKKRDVFASLDIHNNTGINPHYACVTSIDNRFFHLAHLFSRTVIHFTKPEGTQTMAFAKICPSVTVECGKPSQTYGVGHAQNFIERCLHLSNLPDDPIHPEDIEVFHTVAIIKVPKDLTFGFNSTDVNLKLRNDLDHLNFKLLTEGTPIGTVKSNGSKAYLEAWDESGNDVGEKYFYQDKDTICLSQEVMPSMFTLNTEIIRQDCLGYFMERYNIFTKHH